MKKFSLAVFSMTLGFSGAAMAETSSGTLTVTGTIESAISLTIESGGGATGTGTAAATKAIGSVSKYGTAPTGFGLTQGATNYTLSATVGVGIKVVKSNLTSDDYTLDAQLASEPATGVVWKLGGSTVTAADATTLTETGAYGTTATYSWDIVIADSAAAAALDNVITFTATSN